MGVSGSGKTEVGRHLQQKFGIEFIDSDDLHPEENIAKMSAGIPLTDLDRQPWLERICQQAERRLQNNRSIIVACSALKSSYRDTLRSVSRPVLFVHLAGTMDLIHQRMSERQGHYMPAELLQSQFDDLDDPSGEPNVITINIDQDLDSVLAEAERKPEKAKKCES